MIGVGEPKFAVVFFIGTVQVPYLMFRATQLSRLHAPIFLVPDAIASTTVPCELVLCRPSLLANVGLRRLRNRQ